MPGHPNLKVLSPTLHNWIVRSIEVSDALPDSITIQQLAKAAPKQNLFISNNLTETVVFQARHVIRIRRVALPLSTLACSNVCRNNSVCYAESIR